LELAFDGTGYAGGTVKQEVDVAKISGDSGSADNMESYFDGSGYGIQAASALTTVSLPTDGITSSTIATGAIDAAAIDSNAITDAKIAADAITSAKIADDAIGADQLADGAITDAKITATVDSNMKKINDATTGVSAYADAITTIVQGEVAASGSSTTAIVSDTGALSSTDNFYNDRTLTFVTGSLADQAKTITDYAGSSKTFTVEAFTGTPAEDDKFIIS
jgi:hypothetical protein